jgi:hypothetical protein
MVIKFLKRIKVILDSDREKMDKNHIGNTFCLHGIYLAL